MSDSSTSDDRRRNPAFHIIEPNPLLGTRAQVVMNKEMCKSLCRLIMQSELDSDERHLYAFAKRLQSHYQRMTQMYQERSEMAEEMAGAALDTSPQTV